MKLIITQPEIEAIVRAYVTDTVQLREDAAMDIEFTATRSEDGITATINIPYMGVTGIPAIAEASEAVTPAPAKAPRTVRQNKPAQEATQEAASDEAAEDPATEVVAVQPFIEEAEAAAETVVEARAPAGSSLFSS